MTIVVESVHLGDVAVLVPEVFEDERGFLIEVFRADRFHELGLPVDFVQDNHSRSTRNVLRGLHFQWDPPMGKLIRVTYGRAFVVAVDIRKGSPTLGQWHGIELSADNRKLVWAPAGFARGFCVLSDAAEVQYKCTGTYNERGQSAILWSDREVGVSWPISDPVLSARDASAPSLAEWLAHPASDQLRYLAG